MPPPAGRRVELPAFGWLFAVAAALVLLARLARVAGELPAPIAGSDLAAGLASGLLALLPAALLARLPDAPRTHRLLFWGLAGGAVAEWVWAALPLLPLGTAGTGWLTSGVFLMLYLLQAAAALLVALGLLRLRARGPTRGWLLGLIVALQLGFMLVELGLPAAESHLSLLSPWLVLPALGTMAGACAVWVPVSAWLDGEAPRAFWGLLALGFPLGVLGRVVGVGELLALLAPGPGGVVSDRVYLLATVAVALIGIAGSLLALAAYARATPRVPVVPGS